MTQRCAVRKAWQLEIVNKQLQVVARPSWVPENACDLALQVLYSMKQGGALRLDGDPSNKYSAKPSKHPNPPYSLVVFACFVRYLTPNM